MNIKSFMTSMPLVMLLLITIRSQAYEVSTHAWLTYKKN
jgi:hypothetical protein